MGTKCGWKLCLNRSENFLSLLQSLTYKYPAIGGFYTRDALLGQTFAVRLIMRPLYEDGNRNQYPFRRIIFRCAFERLTTENQSNRRIMRLVLVLQLHKRNVCPSSSQKGYSSSVVCPVFAPVE